MGTWLLADAPADVPAVQGRQHQVEDDQVGPLGLEVAHRVAAVPGGHHLDALAREGVADGLEQGLLVVDHQDLRHGFKVPRAPRGGNRPPETFTVRSPAGHLPDLASFGPRVG
jgi:hypothetical protein